MVENVTNVFVLNLCQLRKAAYTDSIGLIPFSIRSTYDNQDNQASRILIHEVLCVNSENLACQFLLTR